MKKLLSSSALWIVAGVVLTVIFISLLISYWLSFNMSNDSAQYWLAWASGNWSAGNRPTSNFLFAVSAVGAVFLNLGNYIALGGALLWLWRMSKRVKQLQESIMKVKEILPGRDLSIKARILSLCPPDQVSDLIPILDKGFSEGSADWDRAVPEEFPELADSLKEILEKRLTPTFPAPV